MDPKYEALFTPWKIGNVEIKNRIVMCSMGGTSLFGWMEPSHFDKEAAYVLLEKARNGVGLVLRAGTSAGGSEMIGLMVIRKKTDFSVGQINLGINLVVYLCCLFFFDIKVVLYSIIAAVASSLAIDKIHTQNIDVEVHVITKSFKKEMKDEIMRTMGRGITVMPAEGAYTGKKAEVLYILISKYEVNQLHQIVSRYDPEAFFVVNERVQIHGNYRKKLDG